MSSQPRRGSKSPRIVLSSEQLEDRVNPAGNVTAMNVGGVLHVIGDSADNRIWIATAGDDTAIIVSLDGTTLNGGRVPLWFDGIKFAYNVRLNGGNDFVYASGLTGTAGLFIDTGHDNDGVSLEHLRIDGAIVNTGTGDDNVHLGGGELNWSAFNLGVGDDRMNVFGTAFGGVTFNGGLDQDSLSVVSVKWSDFPLTVGFEGVFGSLMPVANNDRFNIERGVSVTINELANDRALAGILDPSTVRITQEPNHGTATVNDDGTITYTSPAGLANRTATFKYTVRSSTGAVSNEATVTLIFPVIPDTTGPVPTITTPGNTGTATNDNPIPFQIQFNEDVLDTFTESDITVSNGSISGFTRVNATTFTFNVTPAAQGDVTVSVAVGTAQDKKDNDSSAANKTIRFDNAPPTPVIDSTEPDPTGATSIPITVEFGEAVTDFTLADITVQGGTPSNFQGSGASYTFSIAPTGSGTIRVNIAAGAANDLAGNASLVATEFTIVFDGGAPSVTLSTPAGTPTNLDDIPFQAVFSESVADFVATDITVTNGNVVNFQGSGTTYTFDVQPIADGDVIVAINAGVAHDGSNNPNTAANSITRVSDQTPPTVTVATTEPDPTSTNPIPFTVTFSESVTDFTAGDVQVVNGNVDTTSFTGSGASYSFNVVPSGNNVQVSVSVPADVADDAATNGNAVSNTVTLQFNGSTVSTTLTGPPGDVTNDSPFQITVVFGEAVTGFALADINVTNGAASNLQGSGANYTFDVTPTADGPVVIDVVANAATGDVSGDPTSAAQITVTSDTTEPGGTITGPSSPSNDSPMQFSIQFTEDVTGFELGDITVSNGTPSNLQGSGASYTFEVTPTADGDVVVSVAAGLVEDGATNTNTAVDAVTVVSDTTAPTANITAPAGPTNQDPIVFTITFSEVVTGLELADIVVENGTPSNLQGSGTTYTIDVSPTADGPVNVSVIADAAVDAAGNGNLAAGPGTTQSDKTLPTVLVNDSSDDAITGTSSDTSGVTGVEISINNGTGFWNGTDFTGATEQFFAVTSSDNFGTWSLAFAPGGPFTVHARATDTAGNVGESTNNNVTVT